MDSNIFELLERVSDSLEKIAGAEKKESTLVYTVPEAADALKISKDLMYRLIREGKIRAMKLGALKIPKHEMERFLAEYEGDKNA